MVLLVDNPWSTAGLSAGLACRAGSASALAALTHSYISSAHFWGSTTRIHSREPGEMFWECVRGSWLNIARASTLVVMCTHTHTHTNSSGNSKGRDKTRGMIKWGVIKGVTEKTQKNKGGDKECTSAKNFNGSASTLPRQRKTDCPQTPGQSREEFFSLLTTTPSFFLMCPASAHPDDSSSTFPFKKHTVHDLERDKYLFDVLPQFPANAHFQQFRCCFPHQHH